MSEQAVATQDQESPEQRASRLVRTEIGRLQGAYVKKAPGDFAHPTSESRAALAKLRRGAGKRLGDLPDLLQYVVDREGEDSWSGSQPSRCEYAVYTALTLYAVHQQSRVDAAMHVPGRRLGTALSALRMTGGDENPGVVRRFQAFATAASLDEMATHLRGLVSQLRAAQIGFDYGQLAEDLVRYQAGGERASGTRLRWGRDFFRVSELPAAEAADSTDPNPNPIQEQS